ncbi:MAG: 50S ribosomal protein L18 [Candidatus Micrarchaeota archaeon]|nr:50S ribosomal protein L18 [Candidatus Micrarchaeota archaeon]
MVVRKSTTGVLVQFLSFSDKGDKVISSVRSSALKQYGWAPRCNSPSAYLCGLLAGKLASKAGTTAFNLDVGMQTPSKGSLLYAALKGALDSGLTSNYTNEMITEDRVSGEVIAKYAKSLKATDEAKYRRIFSAYIKEGFAPENAAEAFKAAKSKINSA